MVTASILLLNYNNYFNRLVKEEPTLAAYQQYAVSPGSVNVGEANPITGVNFKPGDDVDTTLIINWSGAIANYLVVIDQETNTINSRWFVIQHTRLRAGQYRISLHRDLLVDYKEVILQNRCFIERGDVQVFQDPAIYNSEEVTVNQIKTKETLLKDRSGSAWIVGYVPKNVFTEDKTVVIPYKAPLVDITVTQLSDWDYYKYLASARNINSTYYAVINYTNEVGSIGEGVIGNPYNIAISLENGNLTEFPLAVRPTGNNISVYDLGESDLPGFDLYLISRYINAYTPGQTNYERMRELAIAMLDPLSPLTPDQIMKEDRLFMELNGKTIQDSTTGRIYTIQLKLQTSPSSEYVQLSSSSELWQFMRSCLPWSGSTTTYNGHTVEYIANASANNSFGYAYNREAYIINLIPVPENIRFTIHSDHRRTNNSAYDMFAIPYSDELPLRLANPSAGRPGIGTASKAIAQAVAVGIQEQLGSGVIFDCQLLPYCPVLQNIETVNNGPRLVDDENQGASGIYLTSTGTTISAQLSSMIVWAPENSFTINIPFVDTLPENILDLKLKHETEFLRLCSPNYAGVFEFNAVDNNGVQYINVDCTYKPFSPYIKANPNFGGIYGQDFDDMRGLVCGGDFSMAQVSNAWADYQLNNKNYQQIFNREISNLRVTNDVSNWMDAFQGVLGIGNAALGGMEAGTKLAGAGAGIGVGAASGALSLVGGVMDTWSNMYLRQEQMDFKQDMWGMQLGNIRAIPNSLAKTEAFTYNNKLFIYVEHYSCYSVEKEAVRRKLLLTGMTIKRPGYITEFITPGKRTFIKAKLIEVQGNLDNNMVLAITAELNKGVYYNGSDPIWN